MMKQPTYFFPTIFALIYLEANDSVTVGLAWGYVIARVSRLADSMIKQTDSRRRRGDEDGAIDTYAGMW